MNDLTTVFEGRLYTEHWVPISGFEGQYLISSFGRIKSLERKVNTWNGHKTLKSKIIKQRLTGKYLSYKHFSTTHRLVALHFIVNSQFKPVVNHRNGCKLDNFYLNLEWATHSENNKHAWETGLNNEQTRKKMSIKASLRTGSKNGCWRGYVDIFTIDGVLVIQVLTLRDAENWIKNNTSYSAAHRGNISRVCNGSLSTIYGHTFKYNQLKNEATNA